MNTLITYKVGTDETLRFSTLTGPDPAVSLANLTALHEAIKASGRPDFMHSIKIVEPGTSPAIAPAPAAE